MSTSSDPVRKEAGPSAQTAPAVRLEDVCLKRRDGGTLLRELSFALTPGSFHWLTGPPGAGKTSVLRLIGLASNPSSGRIEIFGRDSATLTRREAMFARRRIGLALQPAHFQDHLSVWDNAALVPRIVGRNRGEYPSEVDAVLRWVGLARMSGMPPQMLAPADRYRLAIARAIVNRPELLLVDEPFEELDAAARARALKLVVEIHAAGTTVVVASRDLAPAASFGLPVLRLGDGSVSLDAPASL